MSAPLFPSSLTLCDMCRCVVTNVTQPRPSGQAEERSALTVPTSGRLKSEVGDYLHPPDVFLAFRFAKRALSLFGGLKESILTLVMLNRSIPGSRASTHTAGCSLSLKLFLNNVIRFIVHLSVAYGFPRYINYLRTEPSLS